MKFLAERFCQVAVTQRCQRGLVHHVGWNLLEGPGGVGVGDGIGHEHWLDVGVECNPGGFVHDAADWQAVVFLEAADGDTGVRAETGVDLARKEARAIEQDLRAQHCDVVLLRADLAAQVGVVGELGGERRRSDADLGCEWFGASECERYRRCLKGQGDGAGEHGCCVQDAILKRTNRANFSVSEQARYTFSVLRGIDVPLMHSNGGYRREW